MPDQFMPYPSHAPSGEDSPPAQGHFRLAPSPPWAPDPSFDTLLYQASNLPMLTDEEMARILETEQMFQTPFPLPQYGFDMNGTGQMNVANTQAVVPSYADFDSNAFPREEESPRSSALLAESQQRPRQPQALLSPHILPTPPRISRQPFRQPSATVQGPPLPSLFYPPPIDHARQPEYMTLPSAGDLNVSMCEVIM